MMVLGNSRRNSPAHSVNPSPVARVGWSLFKISPLTTTSVFDPIFQSRDGKNRKRSISVSSVNSLPRSAAAIKRTATRLSTNG
jgi:hypothetical protein